MGRSLPHIQGTGCKGGCKSPNQRNGVGGSQPKISSYNGTPFLNAAMKKIGEYLGIDMRQHYAYHLASIGVVEKENEENLLNAVRKQV